MGSFSDQYFMTKQGEHTGQNDFEQDLKNPLRVKPWEDPNPSSGLCHTLEYNVKPILAVASCDRFFVGLAATAWGCGFPTVCVSID